MPCFLEIVYQEYPVKVDHISPLPDDAMNYRHSLTAGNGVFRIFISHQFVLGYTYFTMLFLGFPPTWVRTEH